ncbi:MAG: aspartate kinase [Flavihumibacter sp.]
MRIFKFGGASVHSIDRIKQVARILQNEQELLVVISAMGKTTNALEKVAEQFYNGNRDEALALFKQVKDQHITTAKYLLVKEYLACEQDLVNFFTEVEWLLYDQPVREYDYYYDQIVCIGELLSTCIVSAFLKEENIANQWIDVRDVFRTNDLFRDARIDWPFTSQKVNELVKPLFTGVPIVVTQGFIGATDENESTTLGREGSDYSAAIFANMLDANYLAIWKDVEGVMNADPKKYPGAELMPVLNYNEVIEMAYYGAQVIHPKTIKPLQNKNIPLYVKCFLDPSLPGTVIHNQSIPHLPPIIVVKENQVLLHLRSKDFSFIGEQSVAQLYRLFEQLAFRPNLTQNGAISFTCCLDDRPEKIEQLAMAATEYFDVSVEKGLRLLTIRHYLPDTITSLVGSQQIVLQQQTPETVQLALR